MIVIGEELSERLINEGINPLNVVNITTRNNKNKRQIITKITLSDDSEYELIDNFIYYAARNNKRWY